jgi:hypothetical protein
MAASSWLPLDTLSARWPTSSGLFDEEACGNHFTHDRAFDQAGDTMAATTTSAGEWSAVSCTRMPFTAPPAVCGDPAMPSAPAS